MQESCDSCKPTASEKLVLLARLKGELGGLESLKDALGERLVILGHFYQRDEVVQHADFLGDSFQLANAAKARVDAITAEAEIGKVYTGKVERIVDFGAFVNILPGKDGLVHISQIANERIEKVTDVLQEGQEVKVLVLDVDNRGRIKLSMKDVEAAETSGV